jgi:hypothetical protein
VIYSLRRGVEQQKLKPVKTKFQPYKPNNPHNAHFDLGYMSRVMLDDD